MSTSAPAPTPLDQQAVADFTAAFERWEQNYRDDRPAFMTPEESDAMAVAELSQGRAIYFAALLRELDQGPEKVPA